MVKAVRVSHCKWLLRSEGHDSVLSQLSRNKHQLLERAGFEQAATFHFEPNLTSGIAQIAIDCIEFRKIWIVNFSGQGVCQSSEDTMRRAVVDVRISSVKVAQRFLESVVSGFEHKPFVFRIGAERPTDCQAQLERHIESRRYRRMTVKLDSRQVVKRISGISNQLDDSLESSSGRGNLDGRSRP